MFTLPPVVWTNAAHKQVAKAEGDLLGLAFLDTARGVNPIVQKLPYNLQEKWVTLGSRYKQTHNVPFPPFSVFVDYIAQQAKIRNDPSFDFREKSIEDRKAFLKENNICYRCCLSTSHFAKDCKISVKCTECDSTGHNTALHPGPPPRSPPRAESDHEQGGEERDTGTDTPAVTSQCTEVCKGPIGGRSCSKICLVRVFPKGHKDKAINVYAILDDQSNKSLARSTFFEIFNIKGPCSPYSLKTCRLLAIKSSPLMVTHACPYRL